MELSIWENLLLGLIVIAVIFWMKPGIKTSLQVSKEAESDWMSVLIPIAGVILFVLFLIATL